MLLALACGPLPRALFLTGPGPDNGGSKPFRNGCAHVPEKSRMDELLRAPALAAPAAGATSCPKAGVITAAAIITNKRNSVPSIFIRISQQFTQIKLSLLHLLVRRCAVCGRPAAPEP